MRKAFQPIVCAAAIVFAAQISSAQTGPVVVAATRLTSAELRAWDQQVDQLLRSRDLRVRTDEADALVAGRQHQRLDQYYRGVRIAGGDLTRQLARDGTVSLFGTVHNGVGIDVTPALSLDEARSAVARAASGQPFGQDPELVILPLSDGYHLTYRGQAISGLETVTVFVDANTGAAVQQYSDYINEGVIGSGVGTYGDTKKVSVTPSAGAFVADDALRPADITTYDMKGNLTRTTQILNVQTSVVPSDIGTSATNVWSDGVVVDAHVYAGWYYDYLFKRFARKGLDNNNLRMAIFTHPVRLADIGSASSAVVGQYYVNAFYCSTCGPNGRGAIVLGEGAPRGYLAPGLEVKPFSAALDVVGHELTHGVTAATARLNGFPLSEAGALNEGFSDIFGTSTAFFFQPPGSGPLQASYLQGKDLTVPSGAIGRSMSNPASTGNPDHYSRRALEPHFNSTILSHAFYLAVEGGTNRTSGLAVQGVGGANREQIEKVFFRALTVLLPSNSTFALVREATLQAARDLYAAGGPVERAVSQAWDAVGVQPRTVPTASGLAVPLVAGQCPIALPNWGLYATVSAGTSSLVISQWQIDLFNSAGARLGGGTQNAASFASAFNQCGAGSTRVQAQTDACAAICVTLSGAPSGSVQLSFTALDDANRPVTFSTPRVALAQ